MIGLITVPAILYQCFGNVVTSGDRSFRIFDDNEMQTRQHIAAWIIGGLLVGFGTKMGNGCTSGHGVCGIPRFAPRSIVATCTFMATAFALATLRYYKPFLVDGPNFGPMYQDAWRWVSWIVLACLNIAGFVLFLIVARGKKLELLLNYVFGLLFGFGLVVAGMCRISKIMNFLTVASVWDPSLAFVMAAAVSINVITFNYTLKKIPAPLLS